MIETFETTVLKQAIEKHGVEFQLEMLVEECSELITAIQKLKRGAILNSRYCEEKQVIEEMADVSLVIEAVNIALNSFKEFENVYLEKVNRLYKKLNT